MTSPALERLDLLRQELSEFVPISTSWDLDFDRPLRALEAGIPEATVTMVGKTIERVLKRLWHAFGVAGSPDNKALNDLIWGVKGHIPSPAVIQALRDVQALRNRAAHDGSVVSDEDAIVSLQRLLVILDWLRASHSALYGPGPRVREEVEERAGFLAGLYGVLGYRLAKRFDLSERTIYLLLERARGLRLDYLEIVIGENLSELRQLLEQSGGQLLLTTLPKRTRFLVVTRLLDPDEQATVEPDAVVIEYDDFLRHEIIDVEALRSALLTGDKATELLPATGHLLELDSRSLEYVMCKADDAKRWLRDALVAGARNVLVVGGAGSGKTALLHGLLDLEWKAGPPLRFWIDLGDRRKGEDLSDLITRQLAPFFRIEHHRIYDVFMYIVRAGRALCVLDSLDESMAGSDEETVVDVFLELCEFFSADSSTVLSSRLPLLLDTPWLRQLLDRDALISEKLRNDLVRGGVDPATLPPFVVLRLLGWGRGTADSDSLPALIGRAVGDDEAGAYRALLGLLERLDSQIDTPAMLDQVFGRAAMQGTARVPIAEVLTLLGPTILSLVGRPDSPFTTTSDGCITPAHRVISEALAARWYAHHLETGGTIDVGRLPSENVRRFIYLFLRDTRIGASTDGHVWDGPAIVGPPSDLRIVRCRPGLRIGLSPVTVGQYRRFLDALTDSTAETSAHPDTPQPGDLEPIWERLRRGMYRKPEFDDLPAVGVSWWGAFAYSRWAGGRLPTSLEWEIAARGADGRLFPWGDRADETTANSVDHWANRPLVTYDEWKAAVDAGEVGYARCTPPGQFPRATSACGAIDMGGNVWEWTSTVLRDKRAVIAGGSYDNPIRALRASSRSAYRRDGRSNAVGFRVLYEGGT